MTDYSLFGSGGAVGFISDTSGPFIAGISFKVTAGGLWLKRYRLNIPAGGDTVARTFALQQLTNTDHGVTNMFVPGTRLVSGTLSLNQWNEVPLGTQVALGQGVAYTAGGGWNLVNGFGDTQDLFGSGQTYQNGITSGPLFAYSDRGGSAAVPGNLGPIAMPQGVFSTAGADPSLTLASTADISSSFGIDIVVTDVAPPGASFTLWPGEPYPINWELDDTTSLGGIVTVGTEIALSAAGVVGQFDFYSPATATSLPTKCAIYSVNTQAQVAGTLQSSPQWKNASGAAASPGDGWISAAYSGVTLPAGKYKSCAAAPAGKWNAVTGPDYWQGAGPGAAGLSYGILSAPNAASAASPGQGTYNGGGADIAYPLSIVPGGAYSYWAGITVTPAASGSSLLMASYI